VKGKRPEPWSEAYREATEHGIGYVGTDLLLLGLARTEGPAGDVLRELGATPEKVFELIDNLGGTPARDLDDTRREYPRATPAAEHARGRAEGIAIGLGKKRTHVELLLALAYDRGGSHQYPLARLGIEPQAIVDAVARRGLAVPDLLAPPRPEPHTERLTLPLEQRDVVLRALQKETISHPKRYFDDWGWAYWGMNSLPDRPGYGYIVANKKLHLREFAISALAAAGYPPPPEDAWERREEI
jgi:hypothetical protein